MFTIRQKQVKELSGHVERDFEQRLMAHLKKTFPNKAIGLSGGNLLSRVRLCISTASNHGLESERHIASYAELEFSLGYSPVETTWGRPVLTDPDLAPEPKIRRLQIQAKMQQGGREK